MGNEFVISFGKIPSKINTTKNKNPPNKVAIVIEFPAAFSNNFLFLLTKLMFAE